MPNSRTAAKRLRSDAKRTLRNKIRKSQMKTQRKIYDTKVAENDVEGAQAALSKCFSVLDKAAKAGTIHKNKANRLKGRLAARLPK